MKSVAKHMKSRALLKGKTCFYGLRTTDLYQNFNEKRLNAQTGTRLHSKAKFVNVSLLSINAARLEHRRLTFDQPK